MAGYNADGTRRISRAVRRLERSPRFPVPRATGPLGAPFCKYALTTSTITAAVRGTSTLGKGTGTLQTVVYSSTDVATYASLGLGFDVPLYSGALATIASGRLVQVKVIDGRYHIDVDYCP